MQDRVMTNNDDGVTIGCFFVMVMFALLGLYVFACKLEAKIEALEKRISNADAG